MKILGYQDHQSQLRKQDWFWCSNLNALMSNIYKYDSLYNSNEWKIIFLDWVINYIFHVFPFVYYEKAVRVIHLLPPPLEVLNERKREVWVFMSAWVHACTNFWTMNIPWSISCSKARTRQTRRREELWCVISPYSVFVARVDWVMLWPRTVSEEMGVSSRIFSDGRFCTARSILRQPRQ